jgi:multiple sugar transport system permease protein
LVGIKGGIARRRFIKNESMMAYILLFPAVIFLTVFIFYPVVNVIRMSLSEVDMLGRFKGFVGIDNYKLLFGDIKFWQILMRTFVWTFIAVLVKTVVGMIYALLLNLKFKGRKLARTLLIIPWAAPVPISAILFLWVYNNDFGLLNHTLRLIGIANPPYWLAYTETAFISALYVDIWIGIPFMAVVFLAGLQGIPDELYDAGAIDGAGVFTKFRYITLPLVRPVLIVATLLSTFWTFNDFPVLWILTRGGPMDTTDILITWIYKNHFVYYKPAISAAGGTITFVILLVFSLLYARFYFKED